MTTAGAGAATAGTGAGGFQPPQGACSLILTAGPYESTDTGAGAPIDIACFMASSYETFLEGTVRMGFLTELSASSTLWAKLTIEGAYIFILGTGLDGAGVLEASDEKGSERFAIGISSVEGYENAEGGRNVKKNIDSNVNITPEVREPDGRHTTQQSGY